MTKYNRVLATPLLLTDVADLRRLEEIVPLFPLFVAPKREKQIDLWLQPDVLADSLECYLRRMLSACATTIYLPAHQSGLWARPRKLKSFLSPTSASRVKFVDARSGVWRPISRYFEPILNDLNLSEHKRDPNLAKVVDNIAWDVYRLALAVKKQAELDLDPRETADNLTKLSRNTALSRESRSRLSVIQGLFGLFSSKDDVSGLHLLAGSMHNLRERIDEIMEDAYLLEASGLRRFFGLQAGVASLKRDLRKLLRFIVRERPWAKGILKVASQAAFFPASSAELAEKLMETLPELGAPGNAPMIACPSKIYDEKHYYAVQGQRSVTNHGWWSAFVYFDDNVHNLRCMVFGAVSNIRRLNKTGSLTSRHCRILENRLRQGLIAYSEDHQVKCVRYFLRAFASLQRRIPPQDAALALEPLMPVFKTVAEGSSKEQAAR